MILYEFKIMVNYKDIISNEIGKLREREGQRVRYQISNIYCLR